jgi:hypothetical protein
MARHSRLASSTMLSVRKVRPLAKVSPMKSIDQRSFGWVGAATTMRAPGDQLPALPSPDGELS